MSIRLKRGTRAKIDALAATGGLLTGEPLYITDEQRQVIATGASSYTQIVAFTASHSVTTAYTANTIITNWTVETNIGSGTYSAGVYTVPVTGTYRLSISMLTNIGVNQGGLGFRVNGTNRKRVAYAYAPASAYDMAFGEEYAVLTAGTTVSVVGLDGNSWWGAVDTPVGRWNIELLRG